MEKEKKIQEKREKAAKMREEMQLVSKEKKKKKEKIEEVITEPAIQFPIKRAFAELKKCWRLKKNTR